MCPYIHFAPTLLPSCPLESTFDTATTLNESAKDSRIFTQNTPSVSEPQAAAVEMRNRGFQGAGEGIYLGDNEQARAAESTIYRSNATPKPSKAQSSSAKPTRKQPKSLAAGFLMRN